MATRSTIALEYADGTVDCIYSHWDGYLEGVGSILLDHYCDPFVVQQLMDTGSISSLGKIVGEQHPFSWHDAGMSLEEHEKQYGHMTTFYGRDRGEDGVEARRFESFEDYVKNHEYEEYDYILRRDGVWYVSTGEDYVPVTIALEKQQMEA
jgi:hypothetical protein